MVFATTKALLVVKLTLPGPGWATAALIIISARHAININDFELIALSLSKTEVYSTICILRTPIDCMVLSVRKDFAL